MEPEYVWRCRECGRPIQGAGVGVEPVMFCSTACESEYRRKIELSRKRKQEVLNVEPEIYDPPRTCWNCGREVDGYWVGIEPVTFCSADCEVHYQRKVQRAREMEEARRKIELSRKRKQEEAPDGLP